MNAAGNTIAVALAAAGTVVNYGDAQAALATVLPKKKNNRKAPAEKR
jgi:hypothetical protein